MPACAILEFSKSIEKKQSIPISIIQSRSSNISRLLVLYFAQ
jgi:hypothetical protein